MSSLRQLRIELGWSITKLAQEAGITRQLASAAESGLPVEAETAKALSKALSKAYGREIKVLDIRGLSIL